MLLFLLTEKNPKKTKNDELEKFSSISYLRRRVKMPFPSLALTAVAVMVFTSREESSERKAMLFLED